MCIIYILPGSDLTSSKRVLCAVHDEGRVVACDKKKEPTMAELRAECRRKGLKNYSKLKKDELIRFVTGACLLLFVL